MTWACEVYLHNITFPIISKYFSVKSKNHKCQSVRFQKKFPEVFFNGIRACSLAGETDDTIGDKRDIKFFCCCFERKILLTFYSNVNYSFQGKI